MNNGKPHTHGTKTGLWVAGSALCWCLLLWATAQDSAFSLGHLGSGHRSGSDHYSHVYATALFLEVGFDIYRRPIRELCDVRTVDERRKVGQRLGVNPEDVCWSRSEIPLVINWSAYPRPYPPGQLLYFLPEALALRWAGASFAALNIITVCKLLVVAHLCLLLVVGLTRSLASRSLAWLITGLSYLVFVPWSAMGFYDGIGILVLLLGVRALGRGRPGPAVVWGALALLFHYRAMWYAPLFAVGAWAAWCRADARPTGRERGTAPRSWRTWLETRSDRTWLLAAGLVTVPALAAFFTVMPHLEHFPVNNPLNYRLLSPFSVATCSLAVLTGGGAVLLVARRHWLLLAQLLWCELVIVQAPQAQPWHVMFLWPMVLSPLGRCRGADTACEQEQVTLALIWVLLLAGLAFASPLDARWVVSVFARLIA